MDLGEGVSGPKAKKSPKSLKTSLPGPGSQKSEKSLEKGPKSLQKPISDFFGTFQTFFKTFFYFWDFFETFWLLAPRLPLPGPRNLNTLWHLECLGATRCNLQKGHLGKQHCRKKVAGLQRAPPVGESSRDAG